MRIANKWKIFALSHILSDYTGDGVELFDKLQTAEYGECQAVFEQFSVVEWEPFEYRGADDVADLILDMATRAQETENEREEVTP